MVWLAINPKETILNIVEVAIAYGNMVLHQCSVKGCHSTSNDGNLEVGAGGHLFPIPTEVIGNLQLERKWIELIKVRFQQINRRHTSKNNISCIMHYLLRFILIQILGQWKS